jgi:hypothetical protein
MSDTPSGMKRYYTKTANGEVSYVTVDPKTCSRCGKAIREGCYFVWRAQPGNGACWECAPQANDWERFQLERGQVGLNAWAREQEAKRSRAAESGAGEEDEGP